MNKDSISEIFDRLSLNEDKKDDIYNNIINSQDLYKDKNRTILSKNNKIRKLKPSILCMIILIFTISAYAVSTNSNNPSNNIINWSQSEGATKLNISDSDRGYKITAESVYGDRKTAYVVLSLERLDGKKVEVYEKDSQTNFWINANKESLTKNNIDIKEGTSNYALNNINDDKNKLYFLKKYYVDTNSSEEGTSLIGSKLHLEIDWINVGKRKYGFNKKGNWILDIPLDYKDLTRTYNLKYNFEYNNKKALIENISISPHNIYLYLSSDENALENISLSSFEDEDFFYIRLKDKNMRKLFIGGYLSADNKGSSLQANFSLLESGEVDPSDIEAIVIGDVEIPLNLE